MMKQLLNKFVKEEKGAPIVEIVILIAMSAIIAAFLFPTLRTNLGVWFNEMVKNLSTGIGGNTTAGATNGATSGKDATKTGGGWGKP